MAITIFLLGTLIFGLVLLAVGIICLVKAKNKIIGIITTGLGLVLTLLPIGIFLAITITTSVTRSM
jgi:uncharacterized membrane protein